MSEAYKIACTCDNCERDGEAEFTKGTPVPAIFACPNCGCQTAKKKPAMVYRSNPRPAQADIITVPLAELGDPDNPHSARVWCKADGETR